MPFLYYPLTFPSSPLPLWCFLLALFLFESTVLLLPDLIVLVRASAYMGFFPKPQPLSASGSLERKKTCPVLVGSRANLKISKLDITKYCFKLAHAPGVRERASCGFEVSEAGTQTCALTFVGFHIA